MKGFCWYRPVWQTRKLTVTSHNLAAASAVASGLLTILASFLAFANSASYGLQELSCLAMQRLTGSFEGVDKRLLGELFDDWFNGPSQSKWHVTR